MSSQDAAEPPHPITLYFDPVPGEIHGWAAATDATRGEDELVLGLMVGSVMLGPIRRNRARPDVDAHLGYSGPPPGFALPDFGLRAFARITGLRDVAVLIQANGVPPIRHPFVTGVTTELEFEPLALRRSKLCSTRLVDLWMESNRDLAIRFEGDKLGTALLDAYQAMPGPEPTLLRLAADRPIGGLTAIAAFKLANPFAPVLLVVKTASGLLEAIDFLPFPSLLRGGRHAAERLIRSSGGEETGDVASLSAELSRAWLSRLDAPAHSIATIELDPAVHTGLEPMLNEDVLGWITSTMNIKVEPASDAKLPAYLQEVLDRHRPPVVREGHRLRLPADAIPTISAIVGALPVGLAGEAIAGGMGVVDWQRHGRVWSVWLPPHGNWLGGLQQHGARRMMPTIQPFQKPEGSQAGWSYRPPWPLALVLRERPPAVTHGPPFEVASEIAAPLIVSGASPRDTPLSVLILHDRRDTSPVPLLEALARQERIGPLQIVYCCRDGANVDDARHAMSELFPGRHQIRALQQPGGRLDQIVAMRTAIPDGNVLIADAATLLPDPRTLATLLPMLDAPDVVTAGCMVRSTSGDAHPQGAGYVPAGLDLRTLPTLTFGMMDPSVVRQPATFPVIANMMSALVMHRSSLDAIDATGSDAAQPAIDDLLLGLQVLGAGGLNLSTTIVSAYSDMPREQHSGIGVKFPYQLSPVALTGIMERTTIVQLVR